MLYRLIDDPGDSEYIPQYGVYMEITPGNHTPMYHYAYKMDGYIGGFAGYFWFRDVDSRLQFVLRFGGV